MYIGDIYLPILSSIDKKSVSKITKEIAGINISDPKTVSIRRNLQPVTLDGYLYNDGEKNDAQYAEDVEALQYRSAGYCYTKYADLDGFIEIDNADAPQTSEELGVRNYSVEGKYLPATKYERVVEVETEMRENEFNIEFPPHVALPIGATNVRVKTSQDSVKLSAPAFMAGDIPIYRPFPAFYPDDVTHSDSDTPQYDKTAYKLSYNLLDAKDESISYTMVSGVDVPLGSYRVVLRIKADSTVNGDVKITVSDGTTNVVDSLHTLVGDGVWNIVKTASFSILQRGLTYTVTVSKATDSVSNIAVNYGFLLPEKRARVAFDVATEYDVGECKVYDTVTTDAAEADWIQVYNPEHDFAGDIVVQNSMFRWVIKQTAWKDATKVYNVTGTSPVEIGELYNKAFGDDSVAIKFKEIKPNYLKFTFELDTGNATSESTSAKEIDTVEVTPFNVVIDKDVIGTYKDHYTFESTPGAMVEYENGVIAGIDANSVYGLIKSVDVTSSIDGDIIETTGSESSDSYVVPFVIPCEITSYLYKQAADLVISKDNGDIERKFWKDDFSVDSSSQYTNLLDCPFVINNGVMTLTGETYKQFLQIPYDFVEQSRNGSVKVQISLKPASGSSVSGQTIYGVGLYNSELDYVFAGIKVDEQGQTFISTFGSGIYSAYFTIGKFIKEYSPSDVYTVEVVIGSNSISITNLGIGNHETLSVTKPLNIITPESKLCITQRYPLVGGTIVYDVSVSPSESYSDNFTTDTVSGANGRYQAVTGTVAYDDVNKRMTITAGAGVTAKTRLKSYTQLEGAYKRKLHLPATGTDGDVVAAYFGTEPTLESGFGIGAIRTAGAWNIATIDGATVTDTGTVIADLVDGDSFYVEVERDTTHGVVWYYVYKSGKPTTASGKLFNTYQEIYDGFWFKNKGAAENSIAVSEIEDRAESIVGRTNVELTEEVFNSVTGQMETRTYFKPIHRGSMLETYFDGTQEVVGTTYINDMNWNAGELTLDNTTGGSWAIDTTEGVLKVSTGATARAGCSIRNVKIIDGYWRFRFNTSNKFQFGILQQTPITDSSSVSGIHNGGGYILKLSDGFFEIFTSMTTHLGTGALTLTYNANYLCEFIKTGNRFTLYLTDSNGIVQTATWTDPNNLFTTSLGVCNFYQHYPSATTKIWDFVAIGIDSDATNGIAACIPPIGGGARYGVEESVYNTFTTANVDKGVYLTSAKVKTTNPNADEVSLEYVNETTSTTLDNTSIVVDADYTIKTTPITIKENETDVLTVGVKNSTTCNQPATYVESLSLIPVSGNSVLYPQDLAFISGVKPSQKRKVEVK